MNTSKASSLKKVIALARPEWKTLALATVFLAVGTGMSLLFPQAIKQIIDDALGRKDAGSIDRTALMLGFVFAVLGVAVALRAYLFSSVGDRVVSRLRKKLYEHLLDQEVAFFDGQKSGELTSRLASDTSVLQSAVSANISMGLRSGAMVVGCLTFLAITSVKLTLLMLTVVPPVALAARAYGRKVRKLGKDVQDSLARANEVAAETLVGIRTVRTFSAEGAEAARYGNAVEDAYRLARRRAFLSGSFMGLASFGGYTAGVAVLWYGGQLVIRNELTAGELITFLMYTMMMAGSLSVLAELWADFMKTVGAADRVFELLERAPQMPSHGGEILPVVEGRVVFENVHFSYPSRKDMPVLKGFSLTIQRGERVALVGPSGAGKSTIASLLCRLYDTDEGRITLDGHALPTLDPSWLRRQIGVVSQEPLLFSGTVAENILYGRPGASAKDVEDAARTANALGFVQGFPEGFETRVGERGIQLSGGQKQRVAIARAVLKNPRLLILDEATSALDAESEAEVQEALERLMVGRTSLVIAHRLSTVIDADRVLVLEGGRLIQSGRHAELVSQEGLYRRLVERQFAA